MSIVSFGRFAVDRDSGELRSRGLPIRLREQPIRVLLALLDSGGRVVTREELRHRLWPDGVFVEFDRAINKAVCELRRALDRPGERSLVETVSKRGYRLAAELNDASRPCSGFVRPATGLLTDAAAAYPTLPNEVQLLWYKSLAPPWAGRSIVTLTPDDERFFAEEQARHETAYLAGINPRQQSGFGRNADDWQRFRRVVVEPIESDGSFLDIGSANGLLMESVVKWAREDGYAVEPYGLEVSDKLAALARQRLPHWRDRIFVGNALIWNPMQSFDFVRTELVYVPPARRWEYIDRLFGQLVAPGGRLLVCAYGSSRPEGPRADLLVDELVGFGLAIHRVDDVVHPEHGFVITRVVTVLNSSERG
jgi:DNA-binding winged helix-turn-helix (wHTH) protein